MKKTRQQSPFIRIILIIFIVLLAIYVPLKIYIARQGSDEPVPDGTTVRIYVTTELNGYREPCG